MLNLKKWITNVTNALALLKVSSGSSTINTNNGTVTVQWYRIGRMVTSVWRINPASSWGTGSGNRITCTIPSSIPSSGVTGTGTELNGVFAHLSGTTFRAQNNTGGSLNPTSFDVTICYMTPTS